MEKLQVKNLYKVFGSDPQRAVSALEQGLSKDEVQKKMGLTVALRDVSFTVNEGEFFVVMGLSGSGKSTLLRCLNRLIEPTQGSVLVDRQDLTSLNDTQLRELRRQKFGMVFQRFALFPHRTVLENVEYGLKLQGVAPDERRKRALEVLETVDLGVWKDKYPDQLSGGMQQRVGLSRALAIEPDILLMDEPFSALDPLIRRDMQEELMDLQARLQKTIVFITHDLDEALKLGDRIAVMKDGEIVQLDTAEGILTSPANDYVAAFIRGVNRAHVLTAENIMQKPDALITTKDGPRVALRKMAEARISSVFVVNRNRELKGLITAESAIEAIKEHKEMEKVLTTDLLTTAPDTQVFDLIPMATRAKFPLAVVDDKHRLLGIIVRVSVLSGLVDAEEDKNDAS
ncbi:MAG TPA: glycine betaine/L-proline ABC transporter ATP-binding protein [Oscillospiraceae bacterium]|nr:glycine betaine/L-proline ABC transporter ATP-binding protein [Oscillospiraceae bacterium]